MRCVIAAWFNPFLYPTQILYCPAGDGGRGDADGLPGIDEGGVYLHLAEVGITGEVAVQNVNVRLVGAHLVQRGLETGLPVAHSAGADGAVHDRAVGEGEGVQCVVLDLRLGNGAGADGG